MDINWVIAFVAALPYAAFDQKLDQQTEVLYAMQRADAITALNTKTPEQLLQAEHVAQQLIIRFRPLAATAAQQKTLLKPAEQIVKAAITTVGGNVVHILHRAKAIEVLEQVSAQGPLVLASFPNSVRLNQAIQLLRGNPNVEYVEPNYVTRVTDTLPDDTLFVQGDLWHLTKISAPKAWDTITDAASVRVGVIDTGVDQDHPDLAAHILPGGYDYLDSMNDPDPEDDHGHGSHMSGIIGAIGNNAQGACGIAWKASMMPIRSCGGFYGSCNEFDLAEGLQHAIDNNIQIVNASWGFSTYYQSHYDLIDDLRKVGILFVTSAGNDGWDLDQPGKDFFPCEYKLDNILCVGSTTSTDTKSNNYGVIAVDIGAPGINIYSCWLNGGYALRSGSSMATPCVTGTAALVKALRPDLNYQSIKQAIIFNVDYINPPIDMGLGRLNVDKVLRGLPPLIKPLTVYVDNKNPQTGDGSSSNPYQTISQALQNVAPQGEIFIAPGQNYVEIFYNLSQSVTFRAWGGLISIGQ